MNGYVTYDRNADALYVYLRPDQRHDRHATLELGGDRLGDYAKDGTLIGVEFLSISAGVDLTSLPEEDEIRRLISDPWIAITDTPS